MVKTVRNYRLIKALGHGSFAVVYRAVDTNTGDTVAIKEISRAKIADERSKKHLDAEIRLLKEFAHPNIVRLIDHMASSNNIYLVFEHCGGGDLRVYIDKVGRLTEHTTRFFLLQLCDGLVYLNQRHMIHRDLKPQNILLTEQSSRAVLKIADFGFVKYVEEASVAATMCGTPLYMAPEIVDHFEYDAKVDMWSLGCILFEMLVGKTVFLGSTQAEVLSNVKVQDVVFPSHITVSDQIIGLLQKLLKRTPSSRASIGDLEAVCNSWRGDYDLPAAAARGSGAGSLAAEEDGAGQAPPVEIRSPTASAKAPPATPTSPVEEDPVQEEGEGSPDRGDTDQDEARDDVSQTLNAPYNQQTAARGRSRVRTVSLDTAKDIISYSQGGGQDGVVGINNPRRQQAAVGAGWGETVGVANNLGPLGGVGGSGSTPGTDSKDDDSSWEIIYHPVQSGGNPTPPHGRRRSGGSSDLAGHVERAMNPPSVLAGSSAGSRHGSSAGQGVGSPGSEMDPAAHHTRYIKVARESSRDDLALLEWCKRVSAMIVRVTEVADGILKKAVSFSRRQFLLQLTPAAIHELRLKMLALHMKEADDDAFGGGTPPSFARKSIAGVKTQLNEFTALVNVGFIYFHVIEYLRPCVSKTAALRGGGGTSMASRHPKSSPPSLGTSPGSAGQSMSAVDRVLKHLTTLLDGLQQRAANCLVCSRNIVALLEQDEARGTADGHSPNRLGAGLDSIIEGVQLTKAPSAEVLIYGAARQLASDGSLFVSLGNYKQALTAFENTEVLLDYVLLWTKDSSDRSNIEKFVALVRDEIAVCQKHAAL